MFIYFQMYLTSMVSDVQNATNTLTEKCWLYDTKSKWIQLNIDIYLLAVCLFTIYEDTVYHKRYLTSWLYLSSDTFSTFHQVR